MGVNQVVYGGETIVDLTEDTVTPESMLSGTTAHNKSGDPIVGNVVVTDVIELTKEEYDALPDTKYTDGKHYFVKNYSEGGSGGSSYDFTYSTEEKYTGLRWIDGKKIYQKTFKYSNVQMTYSQLYSTDITGADKGWFHELLFDNNGSEFITNPIMDISGVAILSYRVQRDSTGKLSIRSCGNTTWAASPTRIYYITLRYTKMNE